MKYTVTIYTPYDTIIKSFATEKKARAFAEGHAAVLPLDWHCTIIMDGPDGAEHFAVN